MVLALALALGLARETAAAPPDARALLAQTAASYRSLARYRLVVAMHLETEGMPGSATAQVDADLAAELPDRWRSSMGSPGTAVLDVSDGTTHWAYHQDQNAYLREPLPRIAAGPDSGKVDSTLRAPYEALLQVYGHLDEGVMYARVLREEWLPSGADSVKCWVVDVEREPDPKTGREMPPSTYWIDQKRHIVAQEVKVLGQLQMPDGSSHARSQTNRYTHTSLGEPLPDTLFTFVPPKGAKLVKRFGQPAPPHVLDGKPAPDFTLADLAGKPTTLKSLRGKVVLIDFWATWCGPCRISMPHIANLHRKYKDRGLVVLGIDVGEKPETVKEFLSKNKYVFKMLLDQSRSVMELYKVTGFPTSVVVDREGTIRSYFLGMRAEEDLEDALVAAGLEQAPATGERTPAPAPGGASKGE